MQLLIIMAQSISIISYNVNGIRAAIKNGLLDWLAATMPTILCLQEIKIAKEDFDATPFEKLGYHCYIYPAQKKGYSGVAIFSLIKPKHVSYGIGNELYDSEGRNITADFDGFSVMSAYFPSGTTGDERQNVKMQYLDFYLNEIKNTTITKPNIVIAGDYNICHRPIDIHDPIRNKDTSGFKPEERDWMEKYFTSGFVDSYRKLHPDTKDAYSWWSYRAGARKNNKGWRIDYIAVSEPLSAAISQSAIFADAIHSDHCPIFCMLNLA